MIDHLVKLQSAADLTFVLDAEGAAIPAPVLHEGPFSGFVGAAACTIARVQICTAPAVHDAQGTVTTPAVFADGAWFMIRAGQQLTLPVTPAAITDPELAGAGAPFILAKDAGIGWDVLQGKLEPRFSGDRYPEGTAFGPDMLIA